MSSDEDDDEEDEEEGHYPVTVNSNHFDLSERGGALNSSKKHLCKVWTEPLVQSGCVTAPWRPSRKRSENSTEQKKRRSDLLAIHSSAECEWRSLEVSGDDRPPHLHCDLAEET